MRGDDGSRRDSSQTCAVGVVRVANSETHGMPPAALGITAFYEPVAHRSGKFKLEIRLRKKNKVPKT